MSILKISYCTSQHNLQIALRESEEQREGERPESGNEQRAEAWERAAASEREREWRPASGRESGGWGAGERAAVGERERDWEADWLRAEWRRAGV